MIVGSVNYMVFDGELFDCELDVWCVMSYTGILTCRTVPFTMIPCVTISLNGIVIATSERGKRQLYGLRL